MPITPMFPLEVAMLPGEELPLRIFEPRYSAMVSDCLAGDPVFGVVLIAAGREVGETAGRRSRFTKLSTRRSGITWRAARTVSSTAWPIRRAAMLTSR